MQFSITHLSSSRDVHEVTSGDYFQTSLVALVTPLPQTGITNEKAEHTPFFGPLLIALRFELLHS